MATPKYITLGFHYLLQFQIEWTAENEASKYGLILFVFAGFYSASTQYCSCSVEDVFENVSYMENKSVMKLFGPFSRLLQQDFCHTRHLP